MSGLPFSQACENNKSPILEKLVSLFANCSRVLEIGSGTGQHAIHFAKGLPHLKWQPSDQAEYLPGVRQWLDAYQTKNILPPIELNVLQKNWPVGFDAVFSANTSHIMSWDIARHMLKHVSEALPAGGVFVLYGPFNYNGNFTSSSNANFDRFLREQDPLRGIRDFEKVDQIVSDNGMALIDDFTMPANNRLLAWAK